MNEKSPHKVKGQYHQAVGLLIGLVFGLDCLRFSLGSGYTDFKRASTDNRIIGFQKDKKKLTDIGFRLWSF